MDDRDPAALGGSRALVAVLAGGRGRRIGGAKPTRALAGRPLIDYPLAAARAANLEVVVVAKRDDELPAELAVPTVIEPEEPRHPLCGVLAALEHAAREAPETAVVLVGCDMPFLAPSLLRSLADAHRGAVLIEISGRAQPLPSRCLPEHAGLLRDSLAKQAPLGEALRSLGPEIIDERVLSRFGDARRLFLSVDRPEDLQSAERLLTPPRAVPPPAG
ncbi:MAG TPA: NTP transferase domain-containing protein [Solirubrobacteraceae bacterium]|nr:NTP transferase domain-containing protein [Solirubrobacteraceae bacterium]